MPILKALLLLAATALLCSLTWVVIQLPKATAKRLDAVGERLDQRDKQIAAVLADVQHYTAMATADARANTDTVAYILRDVAEATHLLNTKILPELSTLLASIKASLTIVDDLKADFNQLTASTDADLRAVKPVLDNLATLLVTLDTAVKENSPKVQGIADQVSLAIGDLDKALASDDLKQTMGHVNGISKSTDIIMARMATKAGRLKTILNTLLGAIKLNFYAPPIF